MARGRKRFIAGWGLVGLGLAGVGAIAVSSRYSIGKSWAQDPSAPSSIYALTLGRGQVSAAVLGEVPHPATNDSINGQNILAATQRAVRTRREDRVTLRWWRPDGIGIAEGWSERTVYGHHTGAIVLLWPLVLIALASGTPLIVSARRVRRKTRSELCTACGYDMKGLAAGAGCPECGKAVRARRASEGESAKV
ncbi:MAG: hypothetical protein HEQ23_16585 [Tepidisphaera sp.]